MTDELIEAIERAVAAEPASVDLRVHLAELLVGAGRHAEAFVHASEALRLDPANDSARAATLAALQSDDARVARAVEPPDDVLAALEEEVAHLAKPMFVDADGLADARIFDVETSTVTLADVGGMENVKERLQAAFLAPLLNPDLRRLYSKNLSGGLLMYGPPGCGKTFIARAIAGELGAKFISIGITDILAPMFGLSEANIQSVFAAARAAAPCVLFFDEIDALGARRSQSAFGGLRTVVNQLLTELDGVSGGDDGVFVLAATNQPWDLDPALRRPGRFDRTVLVLPPDRPARRAILKYHLRDRPVEGVDVDALASQTDGYSGADLAYLCEVASERALLDSVRTGEVRMIQQSDLLAALGDVRPSTTAWFQSARNVVMFADDDGTHAELKAYMKANKRL